MVVLGKCGRNFAAGMSGGIAYVLDEKGDFAEKRCNHGGVDLEPVPAEDVDAAVFALIDQACGGHRQPARASGCWRTGSSMLPKFVKVFPHEYKRVLGIAAAQQVSSVGT